MRVIFLGVAWERAWILYVASDLMGFRIPEHHLEWATNDLACQDRFYAPRSHDWVEVPGVNHSTRV
ncbi:MAG: hypothetical protein VYA34_08380 [Myxococcota bacterium]|nr:hypothetical protein [Myxococcota bacterium]